MNQKGSLSPILIVIILLYSLLGVLVFIQKDKLFSNPPQTPVSDRTVSSPPPSPTQNPYIASQPKDDSKEHNYKISDIGNGLNKFESFDVKLSFDYPQEWRVAADKVRPPSTEFHVSTDIDIYAGEDKIAQIGVNKITGLCEADKCDIQDFMTESGLPMKRYAPEVDGKNLEISTYAFIQKSEKPLDYNLLVFIRKNDSDPKIQAFLKSIKYSVN